MVSPPSKSLTVRIIRHGQTEDNLNHIIQGQLNTPLNETGQSQAILLGRQLSEEVSSWKAAFSSDLARAKESAELVLSESSSPPELQVDVRLRERFMSSHQGLSFLSDDRGPLPKDAELVAAMAARALEFWVDVIVPLAVGGEGGTIGLVSHGAFLKTLLTHLSSSPVKLLSLAKGVQIAPLPNTSVTTVVISQDGKGMIKSWGVVEHLVVEEESAGGVKLIVGDLSGGE